MSNTFEIEYKKLNEAQKEAVDTIEGPVMVVAGPGTGKTQVLALRIANILVETDVGADSVLCLTFTNSGVKAMKERLRRYIGKESIKVNVATFHKFAMEMVSLYYPDLSLEKEPKLLDEKDAIFLCDRILLSNEWQYLSPRGDTGRYFRDLKSLISVLKREAVSPEDLMVEIDFEIEKIKNDPENISSRGESKGQMKKTVLSKIESLEKTKEVATFYKLYEKEKRENGFFDYDDYLENLVLLVKENEDIRSDIREKYLYILVDEHQDSSAVQNKFLEIVWGEEEKPNLFVVGDDRQLIYGFSGASLAYFEGFKHIFKEAKLITLIQNYRSTQSILDASHYILESSIVSEKLKSQKGEGEKIKLVECDYMRDEVIFASLLIKKFVEEKKCTPEDCALLLPKNRFVRNAISILSSLGVKCATSESQNFFDLKEAQSFLKVLEIIENPYNTSLLAGSLFDSLSLVSPIDAHKFLRKAEMKNFSLFSEEENQKDLFSKISPIETWFEKLKKWILLSKEKELYYLVQVVGEELLLEGAKDHDTLVDRIEIIRTMLHLILANQEKDKKADLRTFLDFVKRLEEYGERIPLATFHKDEGVKVMTMHASKGLEFENVFILHMDEGSFERGKKGGFVLPEKLAYQQQKKDEDTLKREIYVAITRAKQNCYISYPRFSYSGKELNLSSVVSSIEEGVFEKIDSKDVEKKVFEKDLKSYVTLNETEKENMNLLTLSEMVKEEYEDRTVSVSMLNNFFECPWKWYFRSFLKIPEGERESLIFGNMVHEGIDKILKDFGSQKRKIPSKKFLEDLSFGDPNVLKVLEKWVSDYFEKVLDDFQNEKSVSVKDERFPNLNIYGKIDLFEKDGAFVRVTDFKTGKAKSRNEIEKIDEFGKMSSLMRQLAMYSYLLKTSPKWKTEVTESRLLFLEATNKKEETYQTFVDEEKVDLLVADIKEYDEAMKNKDWFLRPCNFKNYGKMDAVCEYCKMAEIYKNS